MTHPKHAPVSARHLLIAAWLLAANASVLPAQYLMPQPSGSFPSAPSYKVVAGDFNNNGILDAVYVEVMTTAAPLTNGWPHYHFVPDVSLNGIAPGPVMNLSCPGGYAYLGWTDSTAVADFTLDGNIDLALAIALNNSTLYRVVIFPGLGNGQFGPGNPAQIPTPCVAFRTLDVNNDGATDIFAPGSSPTGSLSCWINQWPVWMEVPVTAIGGTIARWHPGDFDGDSLTDILLLHNHFGPYAISVLWGLGNGAFTPLLGAPTPGLPASLPSTVPSVPGYLTINATGDLDNNGCTDFVSVLGSYPAMGWWPFYCSPSRVFTSGLFQWILLQAGNIPSDTVIVAEDVDADGLKDLASSGGAGVQVYRGLGGQQFEAAPMYSNPGFYSGLNVRDLLIADFDGDSDLDALGAPHVGLCFYRNRAITGNGCAGFGQVLPTLGFWNPAPGNTLFSASLAGALGSAPAVLGIALGLNSNSLLTCGVHLDTFGSVVYLPGAANSQGSISWAIPIPNNPGLHGATFHAQAAVLDPMGSSIGGTNLALTPARTVIVW